MTQLFLILFACASLSLPLFGEALKIVETTEAPKAIGPYSQAISVDLSQVQNLIFVSGQVAFDQKTGRMIDSDIRAATSKAMDNVEAILRSAGSSWEHVVRVDIFLRDFERDWDGMNEVYKSRFPHGRFPARQTVGVLMNPDTLIEISCMAIKPKAR